MIDRQPSKRSIRVGAVSYLNTKPLIYGFAEFTPDAELVLDVPSRLADQLAAGELDVALIPSVEAFQDTRYVIVSDACIACRGAVLSVKLLSRVPFARIATLALDEGSRTSSVLVQILLRERFGITPQLCPLPLQPIAAHPGGEDGNVISWQEKSGADAVLLIGDRAMHASRTEYVYQWDLGQEWCRWTGLPFVFAMWTARPGIETDEIELALRRSRDMGVTQLAAIAAAASQEVGLDAATCLAYLRDNLHFTLGDQERRGLQLFHHYAVQHGFAPVEATMNTNWTGLIHD